MDIAIIGLAATLIVRVLVDVAKLTSDRLPDWATALMALASGPLAVLLLLVVDGQRVSDTLLARVLLLGLLAACGASGVAELGKRASHNIYVAMGRQR